MRQGIRISNSIFVTVIVSMLVVAIGLPTHVAASGAIGPVALIERQEIVGTPAPKSPPSDDVASPPKSPPPETTTEPPDCVNGDCPVTPEPGITDAPPVIATPMPYNAPPPRILRCGSRLPVGRQQRIQIVGSGECALRFLGAPGWKLVFIAEPLARDVPVTMTIYDAEGHVIAGPAASEPGIRLELRALQQTSGEHRVVIEATTTVPVLVTWTTEYKMTGRPACGSTLDYGRPVTVSIPSVGTRCEHDFDGHPNQRVRIIIRPDASKIEPAMTLRSPTKKSVTSALATAEVNLPTRGRYTLIITDRYNNAKGAYTVTITLISIATALAD